MRYSRSVNSIVRVELADRFRNAVADRIFICVATVPDLKVVDPSSPVTDKSTGFNPNDTGVLQKK